MNVRKFVASSARDALRKVKEVLGPDAIILSNRAVSGGVEIMAVAASDMETFLTRAAYNAFRFLDTRDADMIKQAEDAVTAAESKITEAGEFVVRDDRKAVLAA